jgi:hypothetical protein
MAAVCAVMLAGCAGGVQQAEISRAQQAQDLTKKLELRFAEVQGRFTEAHIQECLDARRRAGLDITLTGKPLYQANYFYTCVANAEAGTQASLEQAPGPYSIVYSVRAPIRRHPKLADASAAESNAKTQWYYLARCNFKVDESTISYQGDLKPEVFFPYAGGGVKARHICITMPNSLPDLYAVQTDLAFQSVGVSAATANPRQ